MAQKYPNKARLAIDATSTIAICAYVLQPRSSAASKTTSCLFSSKRPTLKIVSITASTIVVKIIVIMNQRRLLIPSQHIAKYASTLKKLIANHAIV